MKIRFGRALPIALLFLASAFVMSGCDDVVSRAIVSCEVVKRWKTVEIETDYIYTGDPSHGPGIPVMKAHDIFHLRLKNGNETFEQKVSRDFYEKADVGTKWTFVRLLHKSGKVTYQKAH